MLGFESADHPVDAPMEPALEIARDARRRGQARCAHAPGAPTEGGGRGRRLARRLPRWRPTCATPSSPAACSRETFETAITWDRFEEFHASVMEAARRTVAEVARRARRGPGRAAGQLPLHPRLPRRRRALLHGPRPGRARRRGRAVGRDQGRRLRGADRRRRHDHPPPRGRPRPPPLVRPPAARPRSPPRCGPRRRSSTRPAILNPGVLIDPWPSHRRATLFRDGSRLQERPAWSRHRSRARGSLAPQRGIAPAAAARRRAAGHSRSTWPKGWR